MMIFFPAIDLKDGQCVRLLRGEMAQATVFGDDPAGQARAFCEAGCRLPKYCLSARSRSPGFRQPGRSMRPCGRAPNHACA